MTIAMHNSYSDRIGDTPLALILSRYEKSGHKDQAKWFVAVSRYISNDHLIEVQLSPADLRKAAAWFERAAVSVETDGGRKEAKP